MPPKAKKIFVLDTSVILYDHESIYNFAEHDVAIPISVLEEVDKFKKGSTVINYNAREFIRSLDKLSTENLLQKWIPLNGTTKGKIRVLSDEDKVVDANKVFGSEKYDHHILNVAATLSGKSKKNVVLVTKDINLRVKARALNLKAEDYETGKIKDLDHLYAGKSELFVNDSSIIDRLYSEADGVPYSEVLEEKPQFNHYFIMKSASNSALAWFNPETENLERVNKEQAYGIKARNAEQAFALHAIMHPEIKLVTITGAAGTGKTLLALAGALEQRRDFHQIYLARPIVPLSNKDIGYLPGDIKSKINPYMQPLWDNLSYIKNQVKDKEREAKKIDELVQNDKLHITPLAYIRGRSLSNVVFIIDEAQNLTPHEVKTIITRAGENCKIIFTGDIFQIDTPYLDAQSNGLSFLVDRISNQKIYAHIKLEKGERSELANLASMML